MVRHVIIWKMKSELSIEEKISVRADMKKALEGLVGVVPGLKEMNIVIDPLASSNVEVMLDTLMESQEALKNYAVHPAHVEVADTYVRPFMEVRMCIDYEV